MKWSEVIALPDFGELTTSEQQEVRAAWTEKHVIPKLQEQGFNKDDLQSARVVANSSFDNGQGYVSSFANSAAQGLLSTGTSALQGIGVLTDTESVEDLARSAQRSVEDTFTTNPELEKTNFTGNVIGNVGAMLGTAGAGGLIGKSLGAARLGAEVGGLGTGFLAGTGGGAQAADQYGITGTDRYTRAFLGGAIELATEKLMFGTGDEMRALSRIPGLRGVSTGNGGSFLRSLASETGEEVAAEIGGNAATSALAPDEVQTPGLLSGTLKAAVGGAIGGGVFGAVGFRRSPQVRAANDAAVSVAQAGNDPGAAAAIEIAESAAVEQLSTTPIGETLRAELSALDLSRPLTDRELGIPELTPEEQAMEVIPEDEISLDETSGIPVEQNVPRGTLEESEMGIPISEDLSIGATPEVTSPEEQLRAPQETALDAEEVAPPGVTSELGATLTEPVENVPDAQPLTDVEPLLTSLNQREGTSLRVEQPDPDAQEFASAVKELTGRDTVFVRGQGSDGYAVPGSTAVLVNLDAKQPMRKLVGHEVAHTLEGTPEFQTLKEGIQQTADYQAYQQNLEDLGYTPEEIDSEFVADVVGENLNNRKFWRSLSQNSPTIFQRVADTALDFIDKVKARFSKSKRVSALKYVANLDQAQEAIRSVLQGLRTTPVEQTGFTQESAEAELAAEGRDPTKWAPQARADATAAMNGDQVAFSRLNRIQQSAVSRTLQAIEERNIRESRSTEQQRFGGKTTLQQEVVKESDIQAVVDTMLQNKATLKTAGEAVVLLTDMGNRNSPMVQKVNSTIRSQFSDYLKSKAEPGSKEYENEVKVLRSFVYQATIGRVMELSSKLLIKGSPSQKKTAAKLSARALAASRMSLVDVPGDSTTAARILRFAQLLNGGDVAAMLHEINAEQFKFVEQKTGITPKQIDAVSAAGTKGKPAAAEMAAYAATTEGRAVLKARKLVQDKLTSFAKFLKSKLPKESRETGKAKSAAERVDELVATIAEDYANVEAVLQELVAMIETLPADQQLEAANRLDEIQMLDEKAAKAERKAGGKKRKLDSIAQRMIDSVNGPPRQPKSRLSQDAADFAVLRKSVRDQVISPEEAVESFVALGGNPELSEALLGAFETDRTNTLHAEALEQDAQASKDLIKEIGEKVAKSEDFEARVVAEGEKARKKASDDLMKMVGEETARAEDFQRSLKDIVDRAAAAAEAAARKAEKAASRVFGTFDVRPETAKRGPSMSQTIQDIIMTHPEWDISDPADKRAIMKEALQGKGFDAATIDAAVNNAVDAFNAQIEKLQQQAANVLLKELKRGKVSQESLFKAIRLQILDPSKGLQTSLAALNGWQGLSPAELSNLYEIGERARQTENQQVRVSLLLDQMRVIYKSTGLSPELRELVSSGIRASAYGGMGSIFTNFTAPVTVSGVQLLRELGSDVVRNPLDTFNLIAEHTTSFLKAVQDGYRSALLAFNTEATKAYNASRDTAEAAKTMKGLVDVDALTRQFDNNLKVLRDPKSSLLAKSKAGLELTWSSQRVVWKVLGAADSLAISTIQKHLTELNLYREIRKAGDRPSDSRDQFMVYLGAQESMIRHAVENLKLSPNAARLETQSRLDKAYFQWLQEKSPQIQPKLIQQEALREAVSMLGNHAEVQGRLSFVVNKASEFFAARQWAGLGPVVSGPIRIIGNIADMAMWWMPGYGIYRAMREKEHHVADDARFTSENREVSKEVLAQGVARRQKNSESQFQLHALTDWQLQRRLNEGWAGTILFVGIIAALTMQPDDDDDKMLEVTTAFPAFNPKEQARWKDKGLKEYTLYLGKGKDRLAVAFTRGAFDFLTYPLVLAARTDKLIRGKTTAAATLGGFTYDVANLAVPTTTNNAKNFATLQQGKKNFQDFLAQKVSVFQPYSALTRSVGKLTNDPINKDASGFQWSAMAPVAALVPDSGDIELRNVLDEKVELNNTWWQKLQAAGFPIYVSSQPVRGDAKLQSDFGKMNYVLPQGYTFNDLTSDIEGREKEVLVANKVSSTGELFQKMNSFRAQAFKEIYKEDPKPSSQANDQRFLDEILTTDTPEAHDAFQKRMATFWQKATLSMKEEFQIKAQTP